MLLSSLGISIANVALPTLAQAFDASFAQVQWIVLAYLLAVTTLIVSAGRLGDLLGRRRLLIAGLIVFTAASLLCGVAPTLPLLIAARAAQGLGAAIMMSLTMAFVGETVPKEKSGSAMGLLGTMSAVGTALGPSLGGVLISAFGWRAIFFATVPPALVALLLAHRFLPIDRRVATERPRFDYAQALRNPGLAMSTLVTTVVMATMVVGPFHLSGTLALDAARVGLVMSCGPIVAALTGVPAGRFVDRFGASRMTLTGLAAMLVGAAMLPMMAMKLGVAGYVMALVTITAGYALFQAANNTAVMGDVRPDQRGVISGMLNLSRNLGLIAGASLMGSLYAARGMRLTFGMAAGLIGAAIVIARSRPSLHPEGPAFSRNAGYPDASPFHATRGAPASASGADR